MGEMLREQEMNKGATSACAPATTGTAIIFIPTVDVSSLQMRSAASSSDARSVALPSLNRCRLHRSDREVQFPSTPRREGLCLHLPVRSLHAHAWLNVMKGFMLLESWLASILLNKQLPLPPTIAPKR